MRKVVSTVSTDHWRDGCLRHQTHHWITSGIPDADGAAARTTMAQVPRSLPWRIAA
jgi:hypothetical protein